MSYQAFTYNGEPIEDIEKWCAERKEAMVRIEWSRRISCGISGKTRIEKNIEDVPELFYNNMRYTDRQGIPKIIKKWYPT